MTKPIARIKLAPGNVGFFDSLTNIRLTKAAPEAIVYSGKNTANIKKAIQEGKVSLIEGTLSSIKKEHIYKREQNIPKKTKAEETKEVLIETSKAIIKTTEKSTQLLKTKKTDENKKPDSKKENQKDIFSKDDNNA